MAQGILLAAMDFTNGDANAGGRPRLVCKAYKRN